MVKKLFIFIVIVAAFISCTENSEEPISVSDNAKTLVIKATLGSSVTKLSYNLNSSKGYTATFTGNERLQMFFIDKRGSTLQHNIINIDPYSLSNDYRSANFVITGVSIPSDTWKIISYIDNTNSPIIYSEAMSQNDLSIQKNLEDSHLHDVLCGSVNVKDLTSTEPGVFVANIKYTYKTSMLRFNLKLPVRPTADNKTVIIISNKNNTIHNIVNFINGELSTTDSKTGDITIYPTEVDTTNNIAVATACVWASDNFKGTRVTAIINGNYYYSFLNLTKETLEGGIVYDVTRTLSDAPKPIELWVTDANGSKDFISGGYEAVTNDWLKYSEGKISWTANNTGLPRTATLNFANGNTYKVVQTDMADFKGNYDFTAKILSHNTTFITAANPGTVSVLFGDPIETEALTEGANTFTNSIGIRGLFYNDVVTDAVIDINHANRTAKLGLFLDGRKAQKCSSLSGTYTYACYLPEMCSWGANGWTSPLNFIQPDLGSPDYTWLWFKIEDDMRTIKYVYPTIDNSSIQRLGHDPTATNDYIIGITIALSSGEEVNDTNVSSSYSVIYQFDKDLTFVRKE